MDLSEVDPAALLQALPAGVVVHGADTRILYANPTALAVLRLTWEQAIGKDALDPQWRFLDDHKQPLPIEMYPVNRVLATGEPISGQVVGIVDGSSDRVTWVLVNAYPERDGGGEIVRVVVTFTDITHQKKDIPFEEIVAYASDAVVVTDADPIDGDGPRIVYVNNAFADITGYTPDEVMGLTPRILQGPDTDPAVKMRIRSALEAGMPVREAILNYGKGGQEYWLDLNIVPLRNALGELTYFAAIERDVTEQKARESLLLTLASKDPLTGVLNRRGFSEFAQSILSNARREGRPVCLGMLDIDFFKRINDTYGHDVGDDALRHLANLMISSFRDSDTLGRLGGEEFAILLGGSDLPAGKDRLDRFCREVADTPVPLEDGGPLAMTVSIGLASFDPADGGIADLMKRADRALYAAKRSGRNRVVPYAGE